MILRRIAVAAFLAALPRVAAAQSETLAAPYRDAAHEEAAYRDARQRIQHVVIIMQENRSFDNYFGTFPHADGIPDGTCVPVDPHKQGGGKCIQPFHDVHDVNAAADHGAVEEQFDLDDGITADRMDGFVRSQDAWKKHERKCPTRYSPKCNGKTDGVFRHDVMGYHTDTEIPNYWAYAEHFVLQDHLFSSARSWSLPQHLYLTSEWAAVCTDWTQALSCQTHPISPNDPIKLNANATLPWVNLFQLLDMHGVSWKYYLGEGSEPDCDDDEMTCDPRAQVSGVASIWNPAPYYAFVQAQGKAYLRGHNPYVDQFLKDIQTGALPQVSWIVPSGPYAEHPPGSITAGMEYVTSLVNAIMQSPYWDNTAIFISWDEWGGFYDHVPPPNVDTNNTPYPIQGYGIRVPGLMISAYARAGRVDHRVLSFDSYATFFENLFTGSARLDPFKMGNPDHRPDIRDAIKRVSFLDGHSERVGDLLEEFDFTQKPLKPLVLSTHIPTGIEISCTKSHHNTSQYCTLPTVSIRWYPVTNPQIPGPFVYHIQRDGTDLPQCIGSGTSCQDQPGNGAHFYRTYSVDSNGVASPLSAAAEADVP